MTIHRTIGAVQPATAVYTSNSIAEMSNCVIAHLGRADLIAIIRHVEEHIPQPDWTSSIDQCDEGTLLRMAFRARECCRHLLENERT